MLEPGVSNAVLGRRLGLDEKAIRRMGDPLYPSHIGTMETALRALGRRLELNQAAYSTYRPTSVTAPALGPAAPEGGPVIAKLGSGERP
jgi:hypothetical protein